MKIYAPDGSIGAEFVNRSTAPVRVTARHFTANYFANYNSWFLYSTGSASQVIWICAPVYSPPPQSTRWERVVVISQPSDEIEHVRGRAKASVDVVIVASIISPFIFAWRRFVCFQPARATLTPLHRWFARSPRTTIRLRKTDPA